MTDLDPRAFLVAIGVILFLAGVLITPVYQPLGNAAFWVGLVLLAIGVVSIVFG